MWYTVNNLRFLPCFIKILYLLLLLTYKAADRHSIPFYSLLIGQQPLCNCNATFLLIYTKVLTGLYVLVGKNWNVPKYSHALLALQFIHLCTLCIVKVHKVRQGNQVSSSVTAACAQYSSSSFSSSSFKLESITNS